MQKQFNVFKQSVMVMLMFSLLVVLVGCPPVDEPAETYHVIFQLNNGSADVVVEVIDGELVQMPNQPAKVGHGFINWFLGDTPYDFNQPVNSDLTIRADWEVLKYAFKVLDFNGNTVVEEQLPYGTYFKPLIPNAPFLFGFRFIGYNTEANTMIDEDITIEPIFDSVIDFVQNYQFDSSIRKVATNDFSNAVLLENGKLYMWGHNGAPGMLCGGYDNSYDILTPTEISGQFDLVQNEVITDIYLGIEGNYAITSHGRFFTWGDCMDCNLGLCDDDTEGYPIDITNYFTIGQESIKQYYINQNYILVVTHSGKIYNSGNYIDKDNLNLVTRREWIDQTSYFNLGLNEGVLKAMKSSTTNGLLTTEGRLFMWGSNNNGMIGLDESISKSDIPVDITSRFNLNPEEKIVDFNIGYYHTLVRTNQGRVFGFGYNRYGQLGDKETYPAVYQPIDMTPALDLNPSEVVIQIINEYAFNSLFITNQGRVLALGINNYNQLTLSDIEYLDAPMDVTELFGYDEEKYKQWVFGSNFIILVSTNEISISGNRTFKFTFE